MSTPTTTFTWTVNTLERTVADGIVSVVHYSVNASDGTYSAGAYGSIGLDAPAEGDEVIAYADLTADTCIGWAQDKLGGVKKSLRFKLRFRHRLMSSALQPKALELLGNGTT